MLSANENINNSGDTSLNLFSQETVTKIAERIIKKLYVPYIHTKIDINDIIQDLIEIWLEYDCKGEKDFENLLIRKGKEKEIIEKYKINYAIVVNFEEEKEENFFATDNTSESDLINNSEKTETEEIEEIEETKNSQITLEKMTKRQRDVWYYANEFRELVEIGIIGKKITQQNMADYVAQKTGISITRQSLANLIKRATNTANIDTSHIKFTKKNRKKKSNVIPMPNIKEFIKRYPGVYISANSSRNRITKIYEYTNYIKLTNTANELDIANQPTPVEKKKANVFDANMDKKNIRHNIVHQNQNNAFATSKNKRKTNVLKIKYLPVTIKANTDINTNTVIDTATNTGTVINFTSVATNKAFDTHTHTHRHLASMQSYKYLNAKSEVDMIRAGPF